MSWEPNSKAMVSFQILRCNELHSSIIIMKLHILLQTSNSYFPLNERIFFLNKCWQKRKEYSLTRGDCVTHNKLQELPRETQFNSAWTNWCLPSPGCIFCPQKTKRREADKLKGQMKHAQTQRSETADKSRVGQYWHKSGVSPAPGSPALCLTDYLFNNNSTWSDCSMPGISEVMGYGDRQGRQGPVTLSLCSSRTYCLAFHFTAHQALDPPHFMPVHIL